MRAGVIFLLLFFCLIGFAQGQENRQFKNYINDNTDGSSFQEAVALKNEAVYKECRDRDCLLNVFNDTVHAQELEYVAEKFGQRGRDWQITGYDEVNAYTLTQDKYYDDLGVQVFATAQNPVLHFDITDSVHVLQAQKYY